jgi:hypothetical protein
MNENVNIILESLIKNVENMYDEEWGVVYLDNARIKGISEYQFRAILSSLSKQGLYRTLDRFAFGMVKLPKSSEWFKT